MVVPSTRSSGCEPDVAGVMVEPATRQRVGPARLSIPRSVTVRDLISAFMTIAVMPEGMIVFSHDAAR
ncbi:MAG: hypothetical protein ACJ72I_18620 [Pseudonocardiaceae bacterium]